MRQRLVLARQRRGGHVRDHETAVQAGVGRQERRQPRHAGIISDIWLANLLAVISGRLSAADARDRIDRATRRVVDRATRHPQTP
ncbi:hypothetical protein R6244_28995 [Mycolicibacterium sp. D5.8-2]|nr:hypothetical protein [Mycolicibacterium sp. D5.8-2]MDW5614916.1 hypothetical protein [Mycolicibacterium sp. D5.8-2]